MERALVSVYSPRHGLRTGTTADYQGGGYWRIPPHAVARVRRALCTGNGCNCGDAAPLNGMVRLGGVPVERVITWHDGAVMLYVPPNAAPPVARAPMPLWVTLGAGVVASVLAAALFLFLFDGLFAPYCPPTPDPGFHNGECKQWTTTK